MKRTTPNTLLVLPALGDDGCALAPSAVRLFCLLSLWFRRASGSNGRY